MGVGVMATLHWPAARGSTGLRRGCRMLMLNWPSWEERRKGGEGRIEDGRPSQAKNAIAPVVGAGRPLCLDRTGSGDTQDEPRDHWHLLADRLVARARREVLGPTGRRLPIPCPGFGCLGAFSGCQPLLLPPSPLYPSYRTPHTPIPGPCESLPRLDPWPFLFLRAPAGPSLPRARRNSMSNFHSYRPPPNSQPWWWTSPRPCSKAWGLLPIFLGSLPQEWGAAARRQAIGNGCQAASLST